LTGDLPIASRGATVDRVACGVSGSWHGGFVFVNTAAYRFWLWVEGEVFVVAMARQMVDVFRRVGVQNPGGWVAKYESGESEWDDDEVDWGSGSDLPVDSACDLENPEACESCQ
jgi:hypothetical protein